MTRNGNLVYTDITDKTVNIVKDTQIYELIKLTYWRPLNVCSTFSSDLLVFMSSDDNIQTKLVGYCGSTLKHTIQFDENGAPLF